MSRFLAFAHLFVLASSLALIPTAAGQQTYPPATPATPPTRPAEPAQKAAPLVNKGAVVASVPTNLAVYVPENAVNVQHLSELVELQGREIRLLHDKIDRLVSLLEKDQPPEPVKPDETATAPKPSQPKKLAGKALVVKSCASCHGSEVANKKGTDLILVRDGELVALDAPEREAVVRAVSGPEPTMPKKGGLHTPTAEEWDEIARMYSQK